MRSGPPVIATFVMLGRIEIVEMLATAGVFVWGQGRLQRNR